MRKLTLESLTVESFETAAPVPARGTVAAHQIKPAPESLIGPCFPTDANFDCTYGCTEFVDYTCADPTGDCLVPSARCHEEPGDTVVLA